MNGSRLCSRLRLCDMNIRFCHTIQAIADFRIGFMICPFVQIVCLTDHILDIDHHSPRVF